MYSLVSTKQPRLFVVNAAQKDQQFAILTLKKERLKHGTGGFMMKLKPRPCPFCGGEVHIEEDWVDAVSSFFTFICDDCGMYTTQNYCMPKEEAIKIWNRRASNG